MILRLVVLQFRNGWRSTVSTAATLALTVAFATFAMVLAATQVAHPAPATAFTPTGYQHLAEIDSVFGDPAPKVEHPDFQNVMSLADVEALVRSAAEQGPVTAGTSTFGKVPGTRTWVGISIPLTDPQPDRYLAHGSLPSTGEIAISPAIAKELHLSIGDTLTLTSVSSRLPTTTATFTISGTLRDGSVSPYWTWVPDAIASWDDVEYLRVSLPEWAIVDPDAGIVTSVIPTHVSWFGDNPALANVKQLGPSAVDFPHTDFRWSDAFNGLSGPVGWALLLAGLTVACLVTASLGMGRSHAESRAHWTATARVLGTTRGAVAVASIGETLVVAALGGGLGVGVGALAARLHLLFLRAAHPDGLLPTTVSVPSVLLGAGILVAVVLAALLAAVPAFWASRVAPVAALKPVTPIREATLSRVVNPWWPSVIMTVGMATTITLERLNLDGSLGWPADMGVMLGQFAWVIAGAAVVVQIARGLVVAVGRWLARSRVTWVLAAGDGLLSHRRSFTFAALAASVLAALLAVSATMSTFTALAWPDDYPGWGEVPHVAFDDWWRWNIADPGVLTFAAIAFAVVAVIATIVRATTRASTAQEDATRSALGLSHRGARAAVALRDSAVMAAGTVIGGLAGWALSLAWRVGGAATFPTELVNSFRWNAASAAYGLAATGAVVGIGLVASVATGLLVSRLAATSPPVEALRQVG